MRESGGRKSSSATRRQQALPRSNLPRAGAPRGRGASGLMMTINWWKPVIFGLLKATRSEIPDALRFVRRLEFGTP